jgi:hypothetical protein
VKERFTITGYAVRAVTSAIGVVGADKAPPHRLSRQQIERAIDTQGFQLWRMKSNGAKG